VVPSEIFVPPSKYNILACSSGGSLCCTTPIPTWLTLSKSLHSTCCKVLDHPPYSLGLSPCDFDMSSSLTKVLTATGSGQTQTSMPQWLSSMQESLQRESMWYPHLTDSFVKNNHWQIIFLKKISYLGINV